MKVGRLIHVIFAITAAARAASAATSEKIQQKASETASATAEYATATKDEFRQKMEADLASLKVKIDDLQTRAVGAADDVRKDVDAQLAQLKKKRLALQKDLDATTDTSGRAWDKMRAGLSRAMGELKVAYNDARREFDAPTPTPTPGKK